MHDNQLQHIQFTPTDAQRMTKSRFWANMKSTMIPAESLTMQDIKRISSCHAIEKWWSKPAFVSWFLDKDTAKHQIQSAAELAVTRLVDIISDDDMGPRGRVTAASVVKASELLMKYSGLEPTQHKTIEYKDKAVQNMTPEQIQSFIKGKLKQMLGAMSVDEITTMISPEAVKQIKEG